MLVISVGFHDRHILRPVRIEKLVAPKPDNRRFRDYPLTGHAWCVPKPPRLTHSGRWIFGRIFRFGRHESYRGLRLQLLFSLTV
jgi:hypothetical protein